MKTYVHKGWYGEGTVFVIEKLEDWDEYEKFLNNNYPNWKKCNPNFYAFKEDFIKYIGKLWEDTSSPRFCLNGVPYYAQYKIIALEDDDPNADWYWVVQNVDDDRDIKYELANDRDFYTHIK